MPCRPSQGSRAIVGQTGDTRAVPFALVPEATRGRPQPPWELSSEATLGPGARLGLLTVPPARSLFNAFVNLESFLLLT